MLQTIPKIVKWVSMPVLLFAAVFSSLAAGYQALAAFAVCAAAMVLALRMAWLKQYYWAAGFAAAFVMSAQASLVMKVFLLLGLACTVVFMVLLTTFRAQPAPAVAL